MDLTSFLLLVVPWIHVVLAPYTKVEESFNLHATHDVFFYGIGRNALKYVRWASCRIEHLSF